jgi:hypothetical protein
MLILILVVVGIIISLAVLAVFQYSWLCRLKEQLFEAHRENKQVRSEKALAMEATSRAQQRNVYLEEKYTAQLAATRRALAIAANIDVVGQDVKVVGQDVKGLTDFVTRVVGGEAAGQHAVSAAQDPHALTGPEADDALTGTDMGDDELDMSQLGETLPHFHIGHEAYTGLSEPIVSNGDVNYG